MSTSWPRWSTDAPAELLAFVQHRRGGEPDPGTPARLLGLVEPARGDLPPLAGAHAVYDAFAARRITYADEPAGSSPGRQTIRPPDEVLHLPRHGTCLDLAVTYAGACLDVGLHPIVLITAGRPGAPAHALVAVWLGGEASGGDLLDYRADETRPDWRSLPEGFLDDLADAEDEPGTYIVIDITGAACRPGNGTHHGTEPNDPRPWAASVAHGARLLREAVAEDRLRAVLDVGLGHPGTEPHPLPGRLPVPILSPPYHPLPEDLDATGPLKLMWARHDLIRFQRRDEVDSLREYFQAPDSGDAQTRIALLHGTGGAGKTRLAAELARRLTQDGWYTGFLNRGPVAEGYAWLSRVASPLLVVVDYAEDHATDDIINLLRALQGRGAPTCLLLTARSVAHWWNGQIAEDLRRTGHPYALRNIPLTPQHPRQTGVYRSALRSFGATEAVVLPAAPPADLTSGPWTTLDLVMLAWLEARFPDEHHPTDTARLYGEILDHEFQYWERTYTAQVGRPSDATPRILREAGACLTLLAPQRGRIGQVLRGVAELTDDGFRRDLFAGLFADLLPTTPEDGTVAVRPDPLGTHLSAAVIGANPDLLVRCLNLAEDDELQSACVGISRFATAAHLDGGTATAMVALDAVPKLWRAALDVAASQGGPFVRALEQLAQADPTPLPLAELAGTIPSDHGALPRLALIATQRTPPQRAGSTVEEFRSARAVWLSNLAVRQGDVGERRAALESLTEAVAILRDLARDNPGDHLPDLAMSLTNLSSQQTELGQPRAALESNTEAVTIRRALVQDDPDQYLPDLATSLNNHSLRQAEMGRLQAGLESATEAVTIRRALAQDDPDEYLPDLAVSLNNLALRQEEAGDALGALDSITRAVQIRRALAERSPAAHLPALALHLANLANSQARAGRRQAAVGSITEAVRIRRGLVGENPAAHLPTLASALSSLSVHQRHAGDVDAAGLAIDEAVAIRRTLAEADPDAHLPDLASGFNNLASHLASVGEHHQALVSITEAVTVRRTLAEADPDAHLPGLAMSLNNLGLRQAAVGESREALASATEAVQHYRTLAVDHPAAYEPHLATALNNLAGRQSDAGDPRGALMPAAEAVAIRRTLAERYPDAHLGGLAMALNTLSVQQADSGAIRDALVSNTESVRIRRTLAEQDPVAHLPELALTLNNLAVRQAEVGEYQAALESATESVGIRRTLAGENSGAHLPDLAMALTTLSNQQSEAGDPGAALASVTEAVAIRRTLAEAYPAAYLADLALSLTNLAVQQKEAGQVPAALESATEAVRICRVLAEQNPGVHLPALATALNNLSALQQETGDDRAALETITEAVEIRRSLAQANPGAYLADLASSLNNLSNRQADAGQAAAAMESITEAVLICRTLVQDKEAAHLLTLAHALTNLSKRQGDAGDTQTAMASISEAVAHVCALALKSPEAHLPNLGLLLKNLLRRYTAAGRRAEGLSASDDVLSRFDPSSAAALLTYRGHQRYVDDDHPGAVADLLDAARRVHDTVETRQTGPARRAVRMLLDLLREEPGTQSAIVRALPDLPHWAKADIPEEDLERLDPWFSAPTWPEKEELLRQSPSLLSDGYDRALVAFARTVYPEAAPIVELDDLLNDVAARGLDDVLAERRARHTATVLVDEWLATRTWSEDLDYLRAHPQLSTDPLVHDLLASRSDDPAARRHLAIVELTSHLDLPDVYDALSDTDTAVDAAMDLIDRGNTVALAPLLRAAPALTRMPFTGPYLAAAIAVCRADDEPSPELLFADAYRESTPVQRTAGAARLRALARHQPHAAAALLRFAEHLSVEAAAD
ncbi:P-loop NTPase [Kitasatospora sp. NPDC054939]